MEGLSDLFEIPKCGTYFTIYEHTGCFKKLYKINQGVIWKWYFKWYYFQVPHILT